ncbi:MAG: PTS sugar transporter subunit IIB [Candidatus Schmidhempelia sp.]|nr:PTS sugar transporter subunit IIB [Candidatus Schmidhempelia sp.]
MKIMAVCGNGLGSSFMVEMNIKKVLQKINRHADVTHSDLASAMPDAADIFVMTKDLADSTNIPTDKLIILNSIIDINELEAKLFDYFNTH